MRRQREGSSRRWGAAILLVLVASTLVACNPATDIVDNDVTWAPEGTAWNGYKVFLSSPRHASSGSRGECRNPGWEENVNGRAWNYYAAIGNYAFDGYAPDYPERNLQTRGYQVTVSRNTRDDGYLANRDASNNWGADLHIVSHTNALKGCGDKIQRTVGMYQAGDTTVGELFAWRLANRVDDVAPGTGEVVCRGDGCGQGSLAELGVNAHWRAYIELVFHTNQASQTWMAGNGSGPSGAERYAWRYGLAIDEMLGYP